MREPGKEEGDPCFSFWRADVFSFLVRVTNVSGTNALTKLISAEALRDQKTKITKYSVV